MRHPAKFSDKIIEQIALRLARAVGKGYWILDPFAGVGRVHELTGFYTVGIEIEPEWADMDSRTLRGDALSLPFPDECFDMIVTSPCYGNRMADNFKAKDDSRRHTYRAYLGREATEGSSAKMPWANGGQGDRYRKFHEMAWREATRVLKPDGLFVLNTSNHIKAGEEQMVTQWHSQTLLDLGYNPLDTIEVETPRNRDGANAHLRVDHETITTWRKRN